MARNLLTFVVLLAVVCSSQFGVFGDERHEEAYQEVVNDLQSIMVDWNETLPKTPGYECYAKRPLNIPALGEELEFPCSSSVTGPSDEIPTSVHRLHPADIKVVGAMGDSISAGNGAGACFLPELIFEYRGLTFSHGGDENFERNPTLSNVLRKFNPDLKGYGVDIGRWDSSEAGMNVGYPGDKANDMPNQAVQLVQKMQADPNIDFENDWKVVSIFIGGNDLCSWCNNLDYYSAENYVNFISEALMILHDQMPRTIVNIVGILQVWQVDIMRAPICNVFHWIFCPCAMFLTPDELATFEANNKEYQVKMEEDIMSGRYDDKDDFTVVLQPFLHNTSVPITETGEPDFSYFAPDCFHFSAKGHAQSGLELWNNMIEPVGAKRISWRPTETGINCPTEEFPYIYTNLNSKPEYWNPPPTTENKAALTTGPGLISQIVLACLTLVLAMLQ